MRVRDVCRREDKRHEKTREKMEWIGKDKKNERGDLRRGFLRGDYKTGKPV